MDAEEDNNIRRDTTFEKLQKLKPVFDKSADGTMTAGNSTPLTDGAAAAEGSTSARGFASPAAAMALARPSHQFAAARPYLPESAGLASVGHPRPRASHRKTGYNGRRRCRNAVPMHRLSTPV